MISYILLFYPVMITFMVVSYDAALHSWDHWREVAGKRLARDHVAVPGHHPAGGGPSHGSGRLQNPRSAGIRSSSGASSSTRGPSAPARCGACSVASRHSNASRRRPGWTSPTPAPATPRRADRDRPVSGGDERAAVDQARGRARRRAARQGGRNTCATGRAALARARPARACPAAPAAGRRRARTPSGARCARRR